VRATATTITLSPRALAPTAATGAAGSGIIVSGRAPATAVPSGGGSSNTAFGLVALIGAGGIALFRARLLASAAGIDDAGTLTALGHSAATFWAGSCYSVGSGCSTTASLAAERISGAVRGDRARFGVRGVASRAADAAGGRIAPPAAPLAGTAAGDDRTRLVAMLLAASAIIGAALGALGPRRQTSGVDAG
jgi:hypothetical protein